MYFCIATKVQLRCLLNISGAGRYFGKRTLMRTHPLNLDACMHACMIVHVFSRVQLSKEPLTQTTQTKEDTNI